MDELREILKHSAFTKHLLREIKDDEQEYTKLIVLISISVAICNNV